MNKRERRTWTPLPEQGQLRCSKGRRHRPGGSLLFIFPPPWGTVQVPTSPVCGVCKRAAQSRVLPFPSHRPPAHPPAKCLEGKPTVTIPVLRRFCQRRKIIKKNVGGTHDCRWLIFFFLTINVMVVVVLSHIRFFVTPWAVACQAPLSMGFSKQEYKGVGCHCLL